MSDIAVDPKEAIVRQASGKMLQYMGAGLPIVCFDTENNREYLGDGGTYVREVTAQSLADAIGTLIVSSDERTKKGQYNQERAKMFRWEKSAEQLEQLYVQGRK